MDFLPKNPFFIESSKVYSILEQNPSWSLDTVLLNLVSVAKPYARPPISHFFVGAAGLGASGHIYLGVNLEFPHTPIQTTVHSEQFVLAYAKFKGETGFEKIAVSAPPCGHCRQFIYEMAPSCEILLLNQSSQISDLLPFAFGPKDLGIEANPWLSSSFSSLNPELSLDALAFHAAEKSYAPYTQCPSAVALETKQGYKYWGTYIENAAFNPGLTPLQGALVAMVSNEESYDEIVRCVLVEKKEPVIKQQSFTKDLLFSIAPKADFRSLTYQVRPII